MYLNKDSNTVLLLVFFLFLYYILLNIDMSFNKRCNSVILLHLLHFHIMVYYS